MTNNESYTNANSNGGEPSSDKERLPFYHKHNEIKVCGCMGCQLMRSRHKDLLDQSTRPDTKPKPKDKVEVKDEIVGNS